MNTIRLQLDSKDPSRTLIDQRTGRPPFIVKGETVAIEFGLFSDTEFVASGGTVTLTLTAVSGAIAEFTTVFNNVTLTPEQWIHGTGHHIKTELSAGITASLLQGMNRIAMVVNANDGAVTLYMDAKLSVLETALTSLETALQEASPPTVYSQAQADARFASVSEIGDIEADIAALQATDIAMQATALTTTPTTLTGAQKAVARQNIGAGLAGAASANIPGNELDLDVFDSWSATLTADTVLTAVGSLSPGKVLRVSLQQDSTGGRDVKWPFVTRPGAALNPIPLAASVFKISEGVVEPWLSPTAIGDPSFEFDSRHRARMILVGVTITSIADAYSSKLWAFSGVRPSTGVLGGRPTIVFAAAGGMTTDSLLDPAAMGCTVVAVFTSNSTADMRLLSLGPLGLTIDQRGGLLEFGASDATANRVSLPMVAGDGLATVAIFVQIPGGGCCGYLYRAGNHKVAYSLAGQRGTVAGAYDIGQGNGGLSRWNGKISRIAAWDFAFSWSQVQELAQQTVSEYV